MKRLIISLLTFALLTCFIFAADGTEGTASPDTGSTAQPTTGNSVPDAGDSASLSVTFSLDGSDENSNYYKIGFTSDVSGLANEQITDVPETSLVMNTSEEKGEKSKTSLYVYWIIKGGQKVKIELYPADKMSGTNDTNKLDWTVSVGEKTSSGYGEKGTKIPVYETQTTDGAIVRGSSEITAIDAPFDTDTAADTYTGSLVLKISPKETEEP